MNKMNFNVGSELDTQIYPEGEPTWGCKDGILDVRDVKDFIQEGNKIFHAEDYGNDNVTTEEFDYAAKKWEKLKRFAGVRLTGEESK